MKKYTHKILAIIMTMILVFSVVAFDGVFATDKPSFSLNRVSETDEQVVIAINLESGEINNACFQIDTSANIKDCASIKKGSVIQDYSISIDNGFAVSSNPKTRQVTVASTVNLSNKGEYFVYTFNKVKADRVQASDFTLLELDIDSGVDTLNNIPSMFSEKSLTYTTSGSTLTITKCRTDAFGTATIPEKIDGKSVVAIANDAFADCNELDGVTIPAGVTYIGKNAFKGCTALKSVTFGNNVKTISEDAFADCTGIDTVTFTGNIAEWCSINFMNVNANPNASAKTLKVGGSEVDANVVIPDGTKAIGNYTLINMKSIKTLTLSNTIETVGESALSGCEKLEMVIIPSAVKTISKNAFAGCTKLTKIGYKSSADDWKKVTIGEGNDALKNAEFTYYYGHSHDYKTVVETVKASCTTDGYTIYKCTMCDKTQKGDEVKATGHKATTWKYDKDKHWQICEADSVKFNEEKHTFDANGGCKCGYIKALIGDINNDGKINSLDALLVLQFVVGQITPNATQKALADTNNDGVYNSTDALRILQYTVGAIKSF